MNKSVLESEREIGHVISAVGFGLALVGGGAALSALVVTEASAVLLPGLFGFGAGASLYAVGSNMTDRASRQLEEIAKRNTAEGQAAEAERIAGYFGQTQPRASQPPVPASAFPACGGPAW